MRMPELAHMPKGEILSILPPATKDIFKVLSVEAIVNLLDRIGGTRLFVPSRETSRAKQGSLAFLSDTDYRLLFATARGCAIWIPTVHSLRCNLRVQNALSLNQQKYHVRDIAITLGVSDRMVHNYFKKHGVRSLHSSRAPRRAR